MRTSRTSVLGLISFPPRASFHLVSHPQFFIWLVSQEEQLVLPYCVATGFQGRVFQEGKPSVQELIKFCIILNVPPAKADHIVKLTAEEGQECESLLVWGTGSHLLSPASPTHIVNCCKTFTPKCLTSTSIYHFQHRFTPLYLKSLNSIYFTLEISL